MRTLGRCAWLATLALLAVSRAAVAQSGQAPRIVVQSEIQGGVEVAAWTPDDLYVVTASGPSRTVTIWEVARRIVIDRAHLPASKGAWSGDLLRLDGMDMAADGRSVVIHGIGADVGQRGAAVSREFRVDLATREVTPLPPRPLPSGTTGLEAYTQRIAAMSVLYEDDKSMSRAAAEKLIPALPRSYDGRLGLRRAAAGLTIEGGATPTMLSAPEATGYDDAALAPDGRRLAMIIDQKDGAASAAVSTVVRFDLTAARYDKALRLKGNYGRVVWLDEARLLVTSGAVDTDRDDDDPDNATPAAPGLVIDGVSGSILATIPARCFIAPLGDGRFIGAGVGNCRSVGSADRGIAIFDGGWKPLRVADLKGRHVNAIAVSPKGAAIAVAVADDKDVNEVLVFDRATGATIDVLSYPEGTGVVTGLAFSNDGQLLLVSANGGMASWKFGADNPRVIALPTLVPQMIASDGKTVAVSGIADDAIGRADIGGGTALPPLDLGGAIAGGFLPGKPIFWSVSGTNGLRVWDTRDWHVMMTTYQFEGQHFLTVTPDGRYDTNIGADDAQFRWIVPDAPFQSLASQTFMRDYFEPRLAQRLIDCTVDGGCAKALKPLRSIAQLNRVLPQVRIIGVTEGAGPAQAIVEVEVREGIAGSRRSGAYNLRVFRDNRYEGQMPLPSEQAATDLAGWRTANALDAPSADGTFRQRFTIDLPTAPGTERATFSAYAFNADRVKSDTARLAYTRAAAPAAPPRAFVVTIGIDAYDDPRLQLRFAASDARLIGDRLAAIPGYEVRRLALSGADPTTHVTRAAIGAAMDILGGRGDAVALKAALAGAGFDASALDAARPDDVVILAFSGHGWADPQGNFYLLPADARWPDPAAPPQRASLISADDLTNWLRAIHTAEAAFVIDACHSAASVDSGDFKPGPMGDAGLGQLAYDKGIRILAATQASDVALEDPVLRQGLLTYALASEGLAPGGAKADLDGDGRIRLDEWLRYATARLPSLSSDVRLGRFGAAGTSTARGFTIINGGNAPPPRAQEPSLFDFNDRPSAVVLRIGQR